ncbi:MAG: ABC-2 type transport system permease protein [Dokdonia sp.]|jgi:hypothetical protein
MEKKAVFALSETARASCFTGRPFVCDIEPAIYRVSSNHYILYGKALSVILGLRDLIREQEANKVLKTITDGHRSVNKLETNPIVLLDEIYKVTVQAQHALIDDWF